MTSSNSSGVTVHSNTSLISGQVAALPNSASANMLYTKVQLFVDVHPDWFSEEQLSAYRRLQAENGDDLPSLTYVAGLCICLGMTINAIDRL